MAEPPRILCLNANDEFREALQSRLSAEGFDVASCLLGAEGLRATGTRTFDLILLDMHWGDPRGLRTFQALKANPGTRGIPMLLLNRAAEETYWEALPYEADGPCYVTGASADLSLLIARVSQLLAEASQKASWA